MKDKSTVCPIDCAVIQQRGLFSLWNIFPKDFRWKRKAPLNIFEKFCYDLGPWYSSCIVKTGLALFSSMLNSISNQRSIVSLYLTVPRFLLRRVASCYSELKSHNSELKSCNSEKEKKKNCELVTITLFIFYYPLAETSFRIFFCCFHWNVVWDIDELALHRQNMA